MQYSGIPKQFLLHLISYVSILLISSCAIKNVEYRRTENFKIEKLSAKPELSMEIVFYNPNGVGCRVSKANVMLMSGNDTVGNAISKQQIKLKSKSEFSVPSVSQISLPVLLKLSGNVFFSNKEVPLDIKGEVMVKKFIFRRKVHFIVHEKLDSKFFSK